MLTVFNLNCWLMPPPISVDNEKRLKKIIQMIGEYHPDFITLQEVWLQKYVALFRKELPAYTFTASSGNFFNQSGLVTGVFGQDKFAEKHVFDITPKHSLIEKWGGKGCHIYSHNDFQIVNTHLYNAMSKEEKLIPASQLKCIERYISTTNTVLCGDLNIEEKAFIKRNTLFDYQPLGSFTLLVYNPYANLRFNETQYSKIIDYVVPTKNSGLRVETMVIDEPAVSDHCPMFAEVFI